MRKHLVLFTTLLSLAIALRAVPALVLEEPFSTDVWPLLRISSRLVSDPDAKIWDDGLFDGYNNRWPGVSLANAVISLVSGVGVSGVYSFLSMASVTVAYSVLMAATLRSMGARGWGRVLQGLLFLIFAPPFLVFTSSTLKEVYAYPFLLGIVYLVVKLRGWRFLLLLTVFSVAISLTHHLASVILLSFLATYTILNVVARFTAKNVNADFGKPLSAFTVLLAVFATYLAVYGARGLAGLSFGLGDVLVLIAYAVFVYGLAFLLLEFRMSFPAKVAAVFSVLPIVYAQMFLPIVAGLDVVGLPYVFYATPLALGFVFSAFLFRWDLGRREAVVALSFLLPVVTFSLYIILYKSDMFSVLHRFLLYTVFPFAIAMSFAGGRGAIRFLASLAILFFAVLTVFNVVFVGDEFTFYWKYGRGEVEGFSTVFSLTEAKCVLLGDAKVKYFGSMVREVSSVPPWIRRVRGECAVTLLYRDNFRFGYAIGAVNVVKTAAALGNMVYNSGVVYAYGV